MGCTAAKSLSEYQAVVPLSSVKERRGSSVSELNLSRSNSLKLDRSQKKKPISHGNYSSREITPKPIVKLPRLSISPHLTTARLKSPIIFGKSPDLKPNKEAPPLIPERKRVHLPQNLLNFKLTANREGGNKSTRPYLTLDSLGGRPRSQAKNSCLAYCQPINVNNQKYFKKSTHKTLKSMLSSEHDKVNPDLSFRPQNKQLKKLKVISNADGIETTAPAKASDLGNKIFERKDRVPFLKRAFGDSFKSSEMVSKLEPSSRTSLNQESVQSGSTRVPLAQRQSIGGSFEKRRPSLALTPDSQKLRKDGKESSVGQNEAPTKGGEDSFAEKFRQTRLSIKGIQRQTRKDRIFSPESKTYTREISNTKGSRTKAKIFDYSHVEVMQVRPARTTAVANVATPNRFFMEPKLKNYG